MKGNIAANRSWWLVSLLTATSVAIEATIALFLPHPYGLTVMALALGAEFDGVLGLE